MIGFNKAVIYPLQFLFAVLTDITELLVGVNNIALQIGDRNDGMFIYRVLLKLQLF